jgi:hypothetical protein
MIGDEVMFVVQTASSAAEIGLGLAEAYADDDLLSDVRVALAIGPVLVQEGDFYGSVVNLASRLVGVANPGTVLVSDEFRTALAAEGARGFETRALRARTLKNIGRIQAWKLKRAGSDSSIDVRRIVRWDRLNHVLHEIEELRERGEQVVRGSQPDDRTVATDGSRTGDGTDGPAGPGSGVVEAGGGDAVAAEVEPTLEGDDGAAPKVDEPA